MKQAICILLIIITLPSCATLFGGHIADCQKHKPAEGQPKRKLRPAAMVFDILLGYGTGLIVDFADGAIYKPCEDKKVITSNFEWSETIEVPGVPKDKLFQRSLEWYNETFKDMRAVIQSQDKEAGTFYGKGIVLSKSISDQIGGNYYSNNDYITFNINIAVKGGKYKYSMTNFTHHGTRQMNHKVNEVTGGDLNYSKPQTRAVTKKQWRIWKEITVSTITSQIIPSLKNKMISKSLPETF